MLNKEIINSIYNARTEIHYNEYQFRNKEGNWVPVDLRGKIRCPLLNESISHQVCSHIMDKETWPRGIDEDICKKCDCFINLSIKKFQDKKKEKI